LVVTWTGIVFIKRAWVIASRYCFTLYILLKSDFPGFS
jgi:hypothetical protein